MEKTLEAEAEEKKEGEEEQKIVYFWPPETEINDQIKSVGLIEAVVRFGVGDGGSGDDAENGSDELFYLVQRVGVDASRRRQLERGGETDESLSYGGATGDGFEYDGEAWEGLAAANGDR